MNFQRGQVKEEPEINLIALIDVLLVILIFLIVTTSYAKYAELKINLPQAAGEEASKAPDRIDVMVDASANYSVNGRRVIGNSIDALVQALKEAAKDQYDPPIVINADAKAAHQSVINIMEAARQAGYLRITFTTQQLPD